MKKLLCILSIVIALSVSMLAACSDGSKSYTVSFDSDGGSAVDQATVIEGNKVEKPSDPSKDGYVFGEWQLNGATYDFDSAITSDITLKAKWLEILTVSFDSDGGSTVAQATVIEGNTVEKPSDPSKDGYAFGEWQLNGATYDFDSAITSDITLKAKWLEILTVSFDSDGGSTVAQATVIEGNTVEKPSDPSKDGYAFGEWQLNGATYDFDSAITSDITLKAKWLEILTVSFDSDGGSTVAQATVIEGNTVEKPSDPSKDGYAFGEWQLNGETYDFDSAVNANIELKATWTPRNDIGYTINLFGEKLDGEYELIDEAAKTGTMDTTITLDENAISLLIPSGFVFDADNESNVLFGDIVADGSLTLTVYMNREEFAVNYYDYNGSLYYSENVKYEDAAVYDGKPVREADEDGIYEFLKWVVAQDSEEEADLTNITAIKDVYAFYKVIELKGIYADIEKLSKSSKWSAQSKTVTTEISEDVLYNGEATLKIVGEATQSGFGVWLDKTLLNTLLSLDEVNAVRLSFNYRYENASNVAYVGIGFDGGDESKNTARTGGGSECEWKRFDTILTKTPANFMIVFSDNDTVKWSGWQLSGIAYVSELSYEAIKDISEGTLIDTAKDDALGYIFTDSTFGTWSKDNTIQFNGKDTLKYEASTNAYAQNHNLLYSLEAVIANLLDQDNVIGVRVSTNYLLTANSGMNFIGLTIDKDGDNFVSSQKLGPLNTWTGISAIFTKEIDQFVFHVSCNQGSGWAAAGAATATVYFADFTYELIYADEEITVNDSLALESWSGSVAKTTEQTYDGKEVISVTVGTVYYAWGCFIDSTLLRELLALPNATSVTVSYKYNAENLSDNVKYIGFLSDYAAPIDRSAGWHTISTNFTENPANHIIGVGAYDKIDWGSSINATGTVYFADISYTVHYGETCVVLGGKSDKQPALIANTAEVSYEDGVSTQVGFVPSYSYANTMLVIIDGTESGHVSFKFKNATGKALEIYTSASLTKNGGPTQISDSEDWQEITLAFDSATPTIYLRGSEESIVNSSEIVYVYFADFSITAE